MNLDHSVRATRILAFTAALLAACGTTPAAAQPGALVISEILPGPARDWDGSGTFSSRDDEWVEFVNEGVSALDLAGYFVTDADSIPRFAFEGTLAAGAPMVVYGKTSWEWERANGHPAFGLSLGNTGDEVILWRVVGSDTMRVDSYAYRSHEAASDRSIGRLANGAGWSLFDGLNPYTGTLPPHGNGCSPTPADDNTCASTPAQASTWGRVKALYR